MKSRITLGLAAALLLAGLPAGARADYIEYDLGTLGKAITELAGAKLQGIDMGNNTKITLPGKAVVQGGPNPLLTYTHPNGTTVHFKLKDVKHIKAPTNQQLFNKMLGQAGKDPEAVMKAAVWALKKGLLTDFYRGVDKVVDLDPKNEAGLKVQELKKKMKEPLPVNEAAEKKFRDIVKRPNMRIEQSNHYMLITDTDTKPPKGKTKTRAQQRLDLLEKVYESFMLLFHAQDVQLDIPTERMMVVLFKNYDQFQEYSIAIHPSLASAAGFYDPLSNVAYFYDFGTDDIIQYLDKVTKVFRDEAKDAKKWKNNPDAILYAKLLDMLLDVQRENSDITVVSHECTHQMAGNTGLFPRHIRTPHWVHEGLASYFEVPSDGVWAGIGDVSRRRVTAYRELAAADRTKLVTNVDFVVSDQIFRLGPEFGYAFGWAMTHFMIENHLKEFIDFYRILGEVPSDVRLNPDLLQKLFHHAVKSDMTALDAEWKAYMKSLKTELEKVEEAEEAKDR
ncbi:MAG: DUF1570 domain-containing protein [Planctomycetia bacterium]|nr:DUF1570 domain-containing protein [Planctomycetia bacterium]